MTNKSNKTNKIILFAGLILIPAFLIYFFASGKQVFVELPYFGPDQEVNGDTVHYKVPQFEFTDHLGNKVNNETLKGKVIIMNTVVNSCPQECPLALGQFYQHAYLRIANSREMKDVVIISHVVDHNGSEADPYQVIADLPKGADVNFDKWMFVTGDYNAIYDVAYSPAEDKEAQNPYRTDGQHVVGDRASNALMFLIDYEGHIRGICPAGVTPGITEIEKQAALLCIEKRHNSVRYE